MSNVKQYEEYESMTQGEDFELMQQHDRMSSDYDAIIPTSIPASACYRKNDHSKFIEQVEQNELSKDEIVKYLKENL